MSKEIVVVGSINLDLVAHVPRMPREGETLTAKSFDMLAGGKGANQAVGAARLGASVLMIGRLGGDGFGQILHKGLEEAGVDMRGVQTVAASSGVALITVQQGGGNCIVVIPGANAELKPHTLGEYVGDFRQAAVILAQLEIPIETVVQLSHIAADSGVPFILDPAPAQMLPPGLLRAVTWLTPNESETRSILEQLQFETDRSADSKEWLQEAATRILATGVLYVTLKLGGRGVFLAGKDICSELIPSFPVEVLDTTAAGDAFNAGLAYALSEGLEPRAAVLFASAVAALSVTRHGSQNSMPSFEDVERFVGDHGCSDVSDTLSFSRFQRRERG